MGAITLMGSTLGRSSVILIFTGDFHEFMKARSVGGQIHLILEQYGAIITNLSGVAHFESQENAIILIGEKWVRVKIAGFRFPKSVDILLPTSYNRTLLASP